jgi:hypothetical protein
LYLSTMEVLRLSRQDNHSSSLPPPLNSGSKQNLKVAPSRSTSSLRNTATHSVNAYENMASFPHGENSCGALLGQFVPKVIIFVARFERPEQPSVVPFES